MTGETSDADRFWSLLDAACASALVDSQAQELAVLLDSHSAVRSLFIDHVQLRRDIQAVCRAEGVCDRALSRIGATVPQMPLVGDQSDISLGPAFFSRSLHGVTGCFSSGWPAAYLIATVVFGVGFVIGALVRVSDPVRVVEQSPSVTEHHSAPEPKVHLVGRITGLVDCQWADPTTEAIQGAHVPLGRKYALASGLMEITYDTGATVILQGPVIYEVESKNGGFMSVGKLTGKVTTETARGLTIRTPTATVIDLGTEFGVEVLERGDTVVEVFAGKVDCQRMTNGASIGDSQQLLAGQAARITAQKVAVEQQADRAARFVRVIPRNAATGKMPRPNALAYWRFEEDVPPPKGNVNSINVQDNVIRDWANRWNHLNYYPGLDEGNCISYVASADVPPISMFHRGYSGGSKSFDSGLDLHNTSILFHDAQVHGTQFNFNLSESFTIEGFFKTAGDQSAAGMMAIVYKDCITPAYMVSLNRQTAGAVQFTVFDSAGKEVSVAIPNRNYADGGWHYFAARYTVAKRMISLLVGNEDRSCHRDSVGIPSRFAINTPPNNLFIGRKSHTPSSAIEGHFRGLIDEIRICCGAIADGQLLFAPSEGKEVN